MTQIKNTIVTAQEAEALKEMIFKRARERAESINKEVQESFTDTVQNEIMSMARYSFVKEQNPFSAIKKQEVKSSTISNTEAQAKDSKDEKNNELKREINNKSNEKNENIAANEIQNAMLSARADFTKKTSFMGALNFLNAQATIALVNKKSRAFEAMA